MNPILSHSIVAVISYWAGNRYSLRTGYETAYEQLLADLQWSYKRVPNFQELFTNSWPLAALEFCFTESIGRLAGNNPIAKSVFRDLTKIPSNIFAWLYGSELGHTNIKYDIGNVYAGVAKTFSKFASIELYKTWYLSSDEPQEGFPPLDKLADYLIQQQLQFASRMSNFVGEPIARVFAIISKEKQESGATDVGYFEYAYSKLNPELIFQAIIEGITKTIIADRISTILTTLNVFAQIKGLSLNTEKVILALFNIDLKTDSLMGRISAVNDAYKNAAFQQKALAMTTSIAVALGLKVAAEITTSFLLSPVTKMAQDASGEYVSNLWPYIKSTYDYYITSSSIYKNTVATFDSGIKTVGDMADTYLFHPFIMAQNASSEYVSNLWPHINSTYDYITSSFTYGNPEMNEHLDHDISVTHQSFYETAALQTAISLA